MSNGQISHHSPCPQHLLSFYSPPYPYLRWRTVTVRGGREHNDNREKGEIVQQMKML